nr:MAG TPA: hypothetical protein [Caudoviricetes sp.]
MKISDFYCNYFILLLSIYALIEFSVLSIMTKLYFTLTSIIQRAPRVEGLCKHVY